MRRPRAPVRPAFLRQAKPGHFIVLALGLCAFLCAYYFLPTSALRQVALYFLLLFGQVVSMAVPAAVVIVNSIGIGLLITTAVGVWGMPAFWLGLLFAGTTAIPFYYDRLHRKAQYLSEKLHEPRNEQIKILQARLTTMQGERQSLEKRIEQINKLYVLGRELVEHMDIHDVVIHLQGAMLDRPGIKSIAMFLRDGSAWVPLHFSRDDDREHWITYAEAVITDANRRRYGVLPTPLWLEGLSIVYWPVSLEKELLAAVFLAVEPDAAENYAQEGSIFIPQIALGLYRTRLFDEVERRSRTDGLTGLSLRRYFLERLQSEIQRAKRYSSSFSLLMIDLDHFKKVNDTYGHVKGDEVLCTIARLFIDHIRPGDIACRYGGEEFVILLPLVSHSGAQGIARQLTEAVSEKVFTSDKARFRITISVGISRYPDDGKEAEELLANADQALYWAKTHGRNGVKEFRDIGKKGTGRMKTDKYQPRDYRGRTSADGLQCFTVQVSESDLHIWAREDLSAQATDALLACRSQLESYLQNHPDFLAALVPCPVEPLVPGVIRHMADAAVQAGVGPMAAVAGAVAEFVGEKLRRHSDEVIVENGGDIYIVTSRVRQVSIYAGKGLPEIRFLLEPDRTPCGVCTSSGRLGHSLSFGAADSVTIRARSAALADAAATAIANKVRVADDIKPALASAMDIPGVEAVIICVDGKIGFQGDVTLC